MRRLDMEGNEVTEGDIVASISKQGYESYLTIGKVVGFTECFVKFDYISGYRKSKASFNNVLVAKETAE